MATIAFFPVRIPPAGRLAAKRIFRLPCLGPAMPFLFSEAASAGARQGSMIRLRSWFRWFPSVKMWELTVRLSGIQLAHSFVEQLHFFDHPAWPRLSSTMGRIRRGQAGGLYFSRISARPRHSCSRRWHQSGPGRNSSSLYWP